MIEEEAVPQDKEEAAAMDEVGVLTTTLTTWGQEWCNYNSRYDKSQVEYYNCHKFGHYSRECKAPNNKVEEKANYADQKIEERSTLLLAQNADDGAQENTWFPSYVR